MIHFLLKWPLFWGTCSFSGVYIISCPMWLLRTTPDYLPTVIRALDQTLLETAPEANDWFAPGLVRWASHFLHKHRWWMALSSPRTTTTTTTATTTTRRTTHPHAHQCHHHQQQQQQKSQIKLSDDLLWLEQLLLCMDMQGNPKPVTAMRGSSFFFSSSSFFFFNLKLHTFSGPFKKQICSVPYKEPASIFPKYKISSSKPTRIEWKKFSVHQSFPKKIYISGLFFRQIS